MDRMMLTEEFGDDVREAQMEPSPPASIVGRA
jgi:hypothetical protein